MNKKSKKTMKMKLKKINKSQRIETKRVKEKNS